MERKNDAVAEIGTTFAELEKSLHQRKGLLVRDLEALCGAKQKVGRGRGGATRCSFLEWILCPIPASSLSSPGRCLPGDPKCTSLASPVHSPHSFIGRN